jgi:hypothetical protein
MNKIKFYPFSEETTEFSPQPDVASKFLPAWYKKTPPLMDNENALKNGHVNATVKKCMPIFDLITAGYVITAPCDIYLDATNSEKLEWSIPASILSYQGDMFAFHAAEQYENLPINKNTHHKQLLRIFPFWAVGTPKGYSVLVLQPAYSDSSPLTALQAIVDTDSFITDGHLSFLVEKDFKGVIKQGTPLIQVIPFKRESWVKEMVSPEESQKVQFSQRLKLRAVFVNAYKNFFRGKKEYR